MRSKVRLQCFFEIFLTVTFWHGVIFRNIWFFPFAPEEEINAQFLKTTCLQDTWGCPKYHSGILHCAHSIVKLFNLYEPCVLYIGQAHRYPPNTPFYIFFQPTQRSGLFPEVKAAGTWRWPLIPSTAEFNLLAPEFGI
jgi:hypothetical protein